MSMSVGVIIVAMVVIFWSPIVAVAVDITVNGTTCNRH